MQTNVDALVVLHVNGHLLPRVQQPPVRGLEILQVDPDDIIALTGGDSLSKLSAVVGIELPSCPFVLGAPDLDRDAEDRTIIRTPNSTKDQSIGLVRFKLLLSGGEGTWPAEGEEQQ